MTVKFLGNGGFISNGLPYNAFLINGDFLVECPPDIMGTLRGQGIDYSSIRRIYLSHFHGDHYFGMPFFTLNLLNHHLETGKDAPKIQVIGPRTVKEHVVALQKTAVSADNPSVAWIDTVYDFLEIDESSHLALPGIGEMSFHRMAHSKETYGFSIFRNGECLLVYLADTRWDDSFLKILSERPACVICDLNGGPADRIKQHMSESEIIEKAMLVTGGATRYIGTHLRRDCASAHENLIYARAGTTIEVR